MSPGEQIDNLRFEPEALGVLVVLNRWVIQRVQLGAGLMIEQAYDRVSEATYGVRFGRTWDV